MSTVRSQGFNLLNSVLIFGVGLVTIFLSILNKEFDWTGLWHLVFGSTFLLLGLSRIRRSQQPQ